eukprot:8261934-Prorocentrum_lima.AAC.1
MIGPGHPGVYFLYTSGARTVASSKARVMRLVSCDFPLSGASPGSAPPPPHQPRPFPASSPLCPPESFASFP